MFSRNRPDRDDRVKHARYWNGRGSRGEYWMMVGMVVVLNMIFPGMSSSAFAAPLMIFTIRRLHDFGQTGWWAAGPLAVGLLFGIAMATSPLLSPILQALLLVGSVAFTAFVGLMPGDKGPNRFGEPQLLFRRKGPDLGQTFS
jgi:uncharacterized membrane protein YhaH (DUF805 family)